MKLKAQTLKCTDLKMIINKLKKMLKVQMDKADALRKESHSTVEKLREEFDSLVREFMNYKKTDVIKARDKTSKSYVPDLGIQKPVDLDKNLGDNGTYHHKRHENTQKESDGKKRSTRESYDEQEKMEVDPKTKDKASDKGVNPPFVPLLSLGKIQ